MKRIGFGIDAHGFFPVLLDGERAIVRLASEPDSHAAMVKGIVWANKEGIVVDVVRVDTRFLEG